MRTSILAVSLMTAAVMPLSACTGTNGGLFSSGDRVYNPEAVSEGAQDGTVIYRDSSGNYYCKREDGTTGTLVGKTIGAILGGAAGALGGRAIDRSDLACE